MKSRHSAQASFLLLAISLAFAAPQVQAQNVGFRQLTHTSPVAVQRGTTRTIRLHSNFTLDESHTTFFRPAGPKLEFLEEKPIAAPRKGRGSKGTPFRFQATIEQGQLPGVYEYRVATNQAVSSSAQLLVTDFPVVEEAKKENGTLSTAQVCALPAAVCGVCERFEDVDCYRFKVKAGEQLTCQIFAQRVTDRIHSMVVRGPRIYLMDPILTLKSPAGQTIAQNDNYFGGDSLLSVRIPADGEYTLEVRDARFAGDQRYVYCVEISTRPLVLNTMPLAVQIGKQVQASVIGHGLDTKQTVTLKAADQTGWSRHRLRIKEGDVNPVSRLTSPHSQMVESGANDTVAQATKIAIPIGISGRVEKADDIDFYTFAAKKGEHFCFDVHARRIGSPLDSVLEIYDSKGKMLTEQDDLGSHRTKDSRLHWTAPAAGQFCLAIRDLHGRGDGDFVYHIAAERSGPDFELFGEYYYAMLAPGTRMMWFARVERLFGFDGPIAIEVEGLPEGVRAVPTAIPSGMNHAAIILEASQDAKINAGLVRVVGRAKVLRGGKQTEVVRQGVVMCEQQSSGGGQARWPIQTQLVAVTKPLDLMEVKAKPASIRLEQGKTVDIEVEIVRAKGFAAAVTLDMSFLYFKNVLGAQLPPGVEMTSKSTSRLAGKTLKGKIQLRATTKAVEVTDLPIAVLARVPITFSITTNYASNPIRLTVVAPKKEKKKGKP